MTLHVSTPKAKEQKSQREGAQERGNGLVPALLGTLRARSQESTHYPHCHEVRKERDAYLISVAPGDIYKVRVFDSGWAT